MKKNKAFEKNILLKVKHQDEHIAELQKGQKALESNMSKGFNEIRDLLTNSKPEYNIEKTYKTVMATIVLSSAIYGIITYAIKSEVAVPINEGINIKAEQIDIKEDIANINSRQSTLSTKLTTLTEAVNDNSAFVYKYLQQDKIPVEIAYIKGRIEVLESENEMMINTAHLKTRSK